MLRDREEASCRCKWSPSWSRGAEEKVGDSQRYE